MPINTPHPEYTANSKKWDKTRDTFDGEDAVKAAGVKYLPMLGGQDSAQYEAYKMRGYFYGATKRTVEGVAGSISRKPPVVKLPSSIDYIQESATKGGQTLNGFLNSVVESMFKYWRVGILVDVAGKGGKPYLSLYAAPHIINWEYTDNVLTLVVLKEQYNEVNASDPYMKEVKTRYRELKMKDGRYSQVLHTPDGTEKFIETTVDVESVGTPLDHIPMYFVNPKGVTPDLDDPPILPISNINLSHYRNAVDIEHGRHFVSIPTPWFSGTNKEELGGKVNLGPEAAIVMSEPQAKAGFLEFTGAGLAELREALAEKVQIMAALGARMLQEPRKQLETAETARIHAQGEMSVAQSTGVSAGSGILKALQEVAVWQKAKPGEVEFEVNRDLIDAKITAQELQALMQNWQAGGMSDETYAWNLKRGELLPADVSVQQELDKIASDVPKIGTGDE